MSRPRTVPDAIVLQAAQRVITSRGPQQFRLADVTEEAGLAPATLVQRFGSKRGLLLALARMAAENVEECFQNVRAANPSPLQALFASLDQMAQMARTPEELANSLAFLQMDLTDPEFRKWTLMSSRASLAGFRQMLDEAVEARELRKCDTQALSRLITAAAHGSLVSWAFFQEGTASDWLRRDLETLLAPYRPVKRTTARRKR